MAVRADAASAVAVHSAPVPSAGTFSYLGAVMRSEGPQGLYKGALAPIAAAGPRSACIFAGYDLALRLRGGSAVSDHALAGAAGGVFAVPITNPMELIKCRAQVTAGGSATSTLAVELRICTRLLQREGVGGLACGLPLTLARDAVYRGVYFATYEVVARAMHGSRGAGRSARPMHVSLLAGGMAGVVAWFPVYPVDVLKTHWQTGRRFNSTTILGMLGNGLAAEGPRWLTRGLAPTLIRTWPLNAIVCTMYETLQKLRQST